MPTGEIATAHKGITIRDEVIYAYARGQAFEAGDVVFIHADSNAPSQTATEGNDSVLAQMIAPAADSMSLTVAPIVGVVKDANIASGEKGQVYIVGHNIEAKVVFTGAATLKPGYPLRLSTTDTYFSTASAASVIKAKVASEYTSAGAGTEKVPVDLDGFNTFGFDPGP